MLRLAALPAASQFEFLNQEGIPHQRLPEISTDLLCTDVLHDDEYIAGFIAKDELSIQDPSNELSADLLDISCIVKESLLDYPIFESDQHFINNNGDTYDDDPLLSLQAHFLQLPALPLPLFYAIPCPVTIQFDIIPRCFSDFQVAASIRTLHSFVGHISKKSIKTENTRLASLLMPPALSVDEKIVEVDTSLCWSSVLLSLIRSIERPLLISVAPTIDATMCSRELLTPSNGDLFASFDSYFARCDDTFHPSYTVIHSSEMPPPLDIRRAPMFRFDNLDDQKADKYEYISSVNEGNMNSLWEATTKYVNSSCSKDPAMSALDDIGELNFDLDFGGSHSNLKEMNLNYFENSVQTFNFSQTFLSVPPIENVICPQTLTLDFSCVVYIPLSSNLVVQHHKISYVKLMKPLLRPRIKYNMDLATLEVSHASSSLICGILWEDNLLDADILKEDERNDKGVTQTTDTLWELFARYDRPLTPSSSSSTNRNIINSAHVARDEAVAISAPVRQPGHPPSPPPPLVAPITTTSTTAANATASTTLPTQISYPGTVAATRVDLPAPEGLVAQPADSQSDEEILQPPPRPSGPSSSSRVFIPPAMPPNARQYTDSIPGSDDEEGGGGLQSMVDAYLTLHNRAISRPAATGSAMCTSHTAAHHVEGSTNLPLFYQQVNTQHPFASILSHNHQQQQQEKKRPLSILVAESIFTESTSLAKLREEGITCFDCALEAPVQIIVDVGTGICMLTEEDMLNVDSVRGFVRSLTLVAFKFTKLWVVITCSSEGGLSHISTSRQYSSLLQCVASFPCNCILRFCMQTRLSKLIYEVCQDAAKCAALEDGVLNDEFYERKFMMRLESPLFAAHAEFCQLFSTMNFYLAAFMLSKLPLVRIVSTDVKLIQRITRRASVGAMIEAFVTSLHAHIGLTIPRNFSNKMHTISSSRDEESKTMYTMSNGTPEPSEPTQISRKRYHPPIPSEIRYVKSKTLPDGQTELLWRKKS